MAGAVHRFKAVLFIFGVSIFGEIDVLFVFVVMTADFPEFGLEDVGGDHFLIPPDAVL